MKHKVMRQEAIGQAHLELAGDSVEDRFAALERENEIERLLADIKSRKSLPA
jgi:phage shock protein A